MEQGWDNVQIEEQVRDLQLQEGNATSAERATHTGGMQTLCQVWSCMPEHSMARRCARPRTAHAGCRNILLAGPTRLLPAPTPTVAVPDLAPPAAGAVGGGRHRVQQGSTHLQSRPELKGLSVPRALLHHVHLGLNALLGIECDPVPLPVIHLHRQQPRRKQSSRGTCQSSKGYPKVERARRERHHCSNGCGRGGS